jgi:hypothetical protein
VPPIRPIVTEYRRHAGSILSQSSLRAADVHQEATDSLRRHDRPGAGEPRPQEQAQPGLTDVRPSLPRPTALEAQSILLWSSRPTRTTPCLQPAPARHTNGTSLRPFRAIVPQLGNSSWLRQPSTGLRPAFPRPRFPASGAVANSVVCHGRQHRRPKTARGE